MLEITVISSSIPLNHYRLETLWENIAKSAENAKYLTMKEENQPSSLKIIECGTFWCMIHPCNGSVYSKVRKGGEEKLSAFAYKIFWRVMNEWMDKVKLNSHHRSPSSLHRLRKEINSREKIYSQIFYYEIFLIDFV